MRIAREINRKTAYAYAAGTLLALGAMLAGAPAAPAQSTLNKVAIANPVKIFNDIKETNDLKAKMESDRKQLEATDMTKRTTLNDLKTARDALKPDSPQYAEKNKALLQASIDYEVWGRLTQMDIARQQKQQIKTLYDKIRSTIGEVATKKGIDLVIAEQGQGLPPDLEPLTVDQLKLLISQQNILYNSALVDISPDVTAAMDQKYSSGK